MVVFGVGGKAMRTTTCKVVFVLRGPFVVRSVKAYRKCNEMYIQMRTKRCEEVVRFKMLYISSIWNSTFFWMLTVLLCFEDIYGSVVLLSVQRIGLTHWSCIVSSCIIQQNILNMIMQQGRCEQRDIKCRYCPIHECTLYLICISISLLSDTRTTYFYTKIPDLKAELKKRRYPVSGKKAELTDRLVDYYEPHFRVALCTFHS